MKILTRLLRHLSIRGLVVLSVAITLLPLMMGLVSAMIAVDRLESISRQAIQRLASETKSSLDLQDRLNELEEKGWKFAGLRDSAALDELRVVHEQFGEKLRMLTTSSMTGDGSLVYGLDSLAREEANVFESIVSLYSPQTEAAIKTNLRHDSETRENLPLVAGWFRSLKAKAGEWSHQYAAHVELKARTLESLSQNVKRGLIFDFILLLPISSILLAAFFYLLHHPMRQIDHFIRALAAGNFTQPVRVVGTGDVEFLGGRLEWLRTRLNDLEMGKQRFVRNVSHEIKTPLATIHEGTELLLDEVVGELNQEQKHIAKILVNSADKLDNLVAKLINYSQVSAGRDYQKMALVDMRQLVLNLLEDYQLQLRAKSIKVAESLEPLDVMGNHEQLRTIVDNLLSNAVKYSPPGGEIRVSLRKQGGHLQFEIEDDGPGIDPVERSRVFEPFFQGRASHDLGIKGTGLGLAIVAECVINHHGKVEVMESSNGDAGALIRVHIPMQSFG